MTVTVGRPGNSPDRSSTGISDGKLAVFKGLQGELSSASEI